MIGENMFGPDPSSVKFANEFGEVINQMNLKLTELIKYSQSLNKQLYESNEVLKEILEEIKSPRKISTSEKIIETKKGKSKSYEVIYPKAYLDEIINNSLNPITQELSNLNNQIERLSEKI